jgi:hypothetical protein
MEKRANGARSPVRPEKRTKDGDEHEHEHKHKHKHKHYEELTMALNTSQGLPEAKQAETACLLVSKASRLTRLNRLPTSKLAASCPIPAISRTGPWRPRAPE